MNLDNWKLAYYVASLRSVSQTQAWEKAKKALERGLLCCRQKNIIF